MTHDILQTDIELATRLRDDHRSDDEIIQALVHRGVEPGPAAQLVDDLRKGKKTISQSPAPLEFAFARQPRAKSASHETGQNHATPAPQAEPHREPRTRPTDRGRKASTGLWWVVAALVGLAVLAGAIVVFNGSHAKTNPQAGQQMQSAITKGESTPLKTPANAAAARQNVPLTSLVLELQPDGLHLGGSQVTRDNVLTVVANALGAATRTNQVAQTATVIYAYDRQGLLIYSQKGGGTNSIVLDCEASGGTHGTKFPFAGTLRIADQVIGPDTDSQTLTAIKTLGLKRLGGGGAIWGGHYNGLELVFAYLNSPRYLSLIEIDLK